MSTELTELDSAIRFQFNSHKIMSDETRWGE